MKNKKMVVKRIVAFLGMLLVMIPMLTFSAFASAPTPTDDERNIWIYGSKSLVLLDRYGRGQHSMCYRVLDRMERNGGTYSLLFAGAKSVNLSDLGSFQSTLTLNSQRLRLFKEGYRENVKVGTVLAYLTVYGTAFKINDSKSYSNIRCDLYYDLGYNRTSYVTFMVIGDTALKAIDLVYVPMEAGIDPETSATYCTYGFNGIRYRKHDGTSAWAAVDDDSLIAFDLSFAFEGSMVTAPDYTLSVMLSRLFVQSYGTNRYEDVWYYPQQDIESLEYGFSFGYSEGFRSYSEGFSDGETSALNATNTFGDLVIGIFEAPGRLIESMLDFDILGINVAGFVKVLLTLSVTAAIVFFILKITKG